MPLGWIHRGVIWVGILAETNCGVFSSSNLLPALGLWLIPLILVPWVKKREAINVMELAYSTVISFSPRSLNSHRRHQQSITVGNFKLRHLREIIRVQRETIERHDLGTPAIHQANSYALQLYEQFGLATTERPHFVDHPDLRHVAK
jgi:hypothetical protein